MTQKKLRKIARAVNFNINQDKDVHYRRDRLKKTVFNSNNKGHITKTYPMFFGDSLGLGDTVNVVNKRLERLKEQQRAKGWFPTEVSLVQDRIDMLKVPKDTADLMVKTILWQSVTDSIASRGIGAMLLPHLTNTEAVAAVAEWNRIEVIHEETYLHIIKQTMPNPDEAILEAYRDINIRKRSEELIRVFDDILNMRNDLPLEEKKEKMAVLLCTLMFMEGVSFMASFAVTFAIAQQKVFQGIAENVTMIMKDELLHSLMSLEMIKACRDVDGWGDIFEKIKPQVKSIYDTLVNAEMEWTNYLFSDGRSVVGLTEDLLKDYVKYTAQTCYNLVGVKYDWDKVEYNPCTYMDKYVDGSSLQNAPQEIQHGNYVQGGIEDDLGEDDDLDFEL